MRSSLEINRGRVLTSPSRYHTPPPRTKGASVSVEGPGFDTTFSDSGGATVDPPSGGAELVDAIGAEVAASEFFKAAQEELHASLQAGSWYDFLEDQWGKETADRERKRVGGYVGSIYAAAQSECEIATKKTVKQMTSTKTARPYLMTRSR